VLLEREKPDFIVVEAARGVIPFTDYIATNEHDRVMGVLGEWRQSIEDGDGGEFEALVRNLIALIEENAKLRIDQRASVKGIDKLATREEDGI
jgi:hypothetical protein